MKKLIWGSEAMALAVSSAGAKYVLLSKTLNLTEDMTSVIDSYAGHIRVGVCNDTDAMLNLAAGIAHTGSRVACFISSSDRISYQSDSGKNIKSGFVYIVIENGSTAHVRGYSMTERLSLFIPETITELKDMIGDAFDYSELTHMPAMIYVHTALIASSEIIGFHRMIRAGINLNDDTAERKRLILTRIVSHYFKLKGTGKTALIAVGDICGILEEVLAEIPEIRFIEIKRILPWPNEILKKALSGTEKRIVAVRKNIAVPESFSPNYEMLIIDPNDPPEQVIESVRHVLGEEQGKFIRYTDISEIRPRKRIPTLPEKGMKMCPGCVYRQELSDLADNMEKKTVVWERVFCEKYMTYVSSGIKRRNIDFASDEYDFYRKTQIERCGAAFEFVRRGGKTCNFAARDISDASEAGLSRIAINHTMCNDCGMCVEYTGCPALWERAFKVHLDREKCTDCGICISKCERKAICII